MLEFVRIRHRSQISVLILVLAICAMHGCGTSIQYVPTGNARLAGRPRPAHAVEVFSTGVPSRPYAELGIIEAQQESEVSIHGAQQIIALMRATAGKLGCDGLLLSGSNDAVAGDDTLKGYRGTCIVFTGPPLAPTPPAPHVCVPNATQLCHGPGACQGAQACLPDGTSYTLCDCDQQPVPATAPVPVPAPAPPDHTP